MISRMVCTLVIARFVSRRLHNAAHGADHGVGIALGAHLHGGKRRVFLGHRQVHHWLRRVPDLVHHRVAGHTDDFAQACIAKEMKPLADRAFVRPEMFRHRFVDDRDLASFFAVVVGESVALQDGNAKRVEIIWRDGIDGGQGTAIAGRFVLALGKNRASESATHRKVRGDRRGLHSGSGTGALHDAAIELLRLAFGIVQRAEINGHHEEFFGLEARINFLRVLLAANEQPRAHQRNQCERGFDDDEQGCAPDCCAIRPSCRGRRLSACRRDREKRP